MMIRIGFDPGLYAQQEHKSLIKNNELIRMAQLCPPQAHFRWMSVSRMLKRIGKEVTVFGMKLESRYSEPVEKPAELRDYEYPNSCC
jgi:hypothetical protein